MLRPSDPVIPLPEICPEKIIQKKMKGMLVAELSWKAQTAEMPVSGQHGGPQEPELVPCSWGCSCGAAWRA